MAHTTIRVGEGTHALFKQLTAAEGRPMAKVLAEALERCRRTMFLESVNAAYAALEAGDREALGRDIAAWDATAGDELAAEPETDPYTAGNPQADQWGSPHTGERCGRRT